MKIGFVLDDSLDKSDGVQQYVITLGRWYSSIGHEVHYLVGQTKRSDIANIHSLSRNIHVRFNKNRMSMPYHANRRNIKKLLEEEQFDVLHVQMPYSPFMAGLVVKYAPKSTLVVGTFHIVPYSLIHNLAGRLLGLILQPNLRRFDQVISASKPAASFAKQSFLRNSLVIPNTVDLKLYSHGKLLKKYSDAKINIVYLGRLVDRKGCGYLLRAIKLLHDNHHLMNVRVVICGKGPLEAELKQYVQDNHLSTIIHFTGFVSETDKPDYLASAHIAVFPSTGGECFGIVLIEAMAAGSEVVLGGNNIGYKSVLGSRPDQLFSPKDTKAFANTLKHFIVNAKSRKLAKSWQAREVKQYNVEVVGHKLLKLYETLIATKTI